MRGRINENVSNNCGAKVRLLIASIKVIEYFVQKISYFERNNYGIVINKDLNISIMAEGEKLK